MIFRGESIRFDKKNLPPYVYAFNVGMFCFFVAWFALCLPTMIIIGYTYGESAVTYVTMCALFAAFFIGLLILYIISLKLRSRLINERAAELEEQFADMPLEKAEQILKENGVITEHGFVSSRGDLFGEKVVPFNQAELFVYADGCDVLVNDRGVKKVTRPLKININLELRDGVDVQCCATYAMDGALFNFVNKRNLITDYENNREFFWLKTDRKNLVRSAFGFRLK